jgi:hypothetical protein
VRLSLDQDSDDPDSFLHANLPGSLESLVDELKAKPGELDPVDDRLIEDLFRAVLKIRRTAMNESVNQLRFLQEEAQKSGDLRATLYRDMVQQYSMSLRGLDQAKLKPNGQHRHKEGQ